MIIVASQRSGARALADHLMNDRENDHVALAKIEGFIADDLHGALDEAFAISKATQCKQFMFSVSINPPEDFVASDEELGQAADRVAETMGLSEQAHAMVIHEKNGRRHAHVVWSRIDVETMTAINLPHFKRKMRDLSRDLFLDHGWELPKGLQTYGLKDPLNFSLGEWQQAQRIGVDPREMKQLFRNAWAQSDDLKSLNNALRDKGLYLAKGNKRGVVALDIEGNIYALARWSGVKTKEIKARLSEPTDLQPMADVFAWLQSRKTEQVKSYIRQVKAKHAQDMRPLLEERDRMVAAHRDERQKLNAKQKERWTVETKGRLDRLNKGLRGLFDRITGAHQRTVRRNDLEALRCFERDQAQRNNLVQAQMLERKELRSEAFVVETQQRIDRQSLVRNIASFLKRSPAYVDRQYMQRTSNDRSLSKNRLR